MLLVIFSARSYKTEIQNINNMAYSLNNVIIKSTIENILWILRVSLTFNVNYLLIKQ